MISVLNFIEVFASSASVIRTIIMIIQQTARSSLKITLIQVLIISIAVKKNKSVLPFIKTMLRAI